MYPYDGITIYNEDIAIACYSSYTIWSWHSHHSIFQDRLKPPRRPRAKTSPSGPRGWEMRNGSGMGWAPFWDGNMPQGSKDEPWDVSRRLMRISHSLTYPLEASQWDVPWKTCAKKLKPTTSRKGRTACRCMNLVAGVTFFLFIKACISVETSWNDIHQKECEIMWNHLA